MVFVALFASCVRFWVWIGCGGFGGFASVGGFVWWAGFLLALVLGVIVDLPCLLWFWAI